MSTRQTYGPLLEWAPGIWIRDGEWYGTAFRRRMTVFRLGNDSLWVHNPFDLESQDIETLKSLGRITGIIAPNTFHASDLATFRAHFLEAKTYCPSAITNQYPGALNWSYLPVSNEILWHPAAGTRMDELLLVHKPSGTMIATDLVFNMPSGSFHGFEKWLMGWNGVDGRFGPSKICKMFFVKQKTAFEASIRKTFSYDFNRVIMNHGKPVSEDGKKLWIESFCARFNWKLKN